MEGYHHHDHDADIDDENDWKAMDSDEDLPVLGGNDDVDGIEGAERDDDADIGFRSHQFRYGSIGRRKRSRKQNQEEAIYGVFYESEGEGGDKTGRDGGREVGAGAPVFVAASKPQGEDPSPPAPFFVAAAKEPEEGPPAPMFVAAGASKARETPPSGEPGAATTAEKAPDPEREEDDRLAEEQRAADDRFRGLLEKARAKNRRSRDSRPGGAGGAAPAGGPGAEGGKGPGEPALPLGGLPSSFGGLGFGGLGHGESTTKPPRARDPTVGTWEKHTKGFGSKILSRMGWKGSGGLGSNRRCFRGEAPPSGDHEKDNAEGATPGAARPESTAPATGSVKKGISRPVEVVVRPSNMGLGFGNFKEASQLKTNRRIEAEVRGIDYDAQLRKEKEEQRAKRRRQRAQRYGEDPGSDTENDGDDDDDDDEDDPTRTMNSSAIASTEDLLSNRSWRARRSKKKKKTGNAPEIIPYAELIERQKKQSGGASGGQPVIIDMRGPGYAERAKATPTGSGVALGEELMYNLSFLLNTYENKLHSSARYHETSILPKIEKAERDIRDLEDRALEAKTRLDKLRKAYEITDRVRQTVSGATAAGKAKTVTNENTNANANFESARLEVKQLVAELEGVFTPQERRDLQFWNVLAPTLLGPIVHATLEHWNPLFASSGVDRTGDDRRIVDSFFEWKSPERATNHEKTSREDSRALCESMIRNQLVPKLKADIEAESSPRWDPIRDPYAVLDLYEYLHAKAVAFDNEARDGTNDGGKPSNEENEDPNQIFPSGQAYKETEGSSKPESDLAEYIRNELIITAVYPKLQNCIQRWKPDFSRSSEKRTLENPLHLWVLPWLPCIDHPALLPNLVTDCKRTLRGALSFLHRKLSAPGNDREYVVAATDLLRPWQAVLGARSIPQMVSKDSTVVSRLARLLSSWNAAAARPGEKEPPNWQDLRLLFELHGRKMISDVDFLSTIEGPVLTNWARSVHELLWGQVSSAESDSGTAPTGTQDPAVETAVGVYRDWKIRVLVDPLSSDDSPITSFPAKNTGDKPAFSCDHSLRLLRDDVQTCRIFCSVLHMIQICKSPSMAASAKLEALDPLEPQMPGFRAIWNRRSLEEKQAIQEDFVRMESRSEGETRARIVLKRRNVAEPTFREVVEEFASDRGVLFQPRMGGKALKDGKQVYLFGDLPLYLEGDVIFCHKDSVWRPVSLDQLVGLASNKT